MDSKELRPTDVEISTIVAGTEEAKQAELVVADNTTPVVASGDNLPATTSENDPYQAELDKDIDEMNYDFVTTRQNLNNVLQVGLEGVRSCMTLAEGSDHPRVFEALATLINSVTTANKDMLELHEKRQKMKAVRRTERSPNRNPAHEHKQGTADTHIQQVNNVVFTGTTKDLLAAIKRNPGNDGGEDI